MIGDDVKLLSVYDVLNKYIVTLPYYQRSYTWSEKEITQFLDDIYKYTKSDNNYYIGNIVAYNNGVDKKIYIIDGQQRITTLFLIINAIRLINKKVFDKFNVDFFDEDIPKFDTETASPFCYDLFSLDDIKKIKQSMIDEESIDFTKMNLYYGQSVVLGYFKKKKLFDKIDKILGNVKFVLLLCKNKEDGYLVFENINSKGVSLSNSDLIKSAFLSKISSGRTGNDFKTKKYLKWKEIENNYYPILNADDTYKKINKKNKEAIQNFAKLFNYYNILQKGIRISSNTYKLYNEYLKSIESINNSELLMKELDNLSDISKSFNFIINYKSSSIPDLEEIRLAILFFDCFGYTQYIPFALSIITKLNNRKYRSSKKRIYKLFYRLALFHFVFNTLMSQRPSLIGNFYNDLSSKIYKEEVSIKTIEEEVNSMILNALKKLFDINDENDIARFITECVNKLNYIAFDTDRAKGLLPKNSDYKKVKETDELKFIFGVLESHIKKDYSNLPTVDTIEHIDSLSGDQKKNYDNYILFNTLPLEENLNNLLGSNELPDKIELYKKSHYSLTKNFCKMYDLHNGDCSIVKQELSSEIVRLILSIVCDKDI